MMTRRGALGLMAGACLMAPTGALAATAVREFAVLRAGRDIGRHRIALTRDGEALRVDIDIELVVRVLGIPAYRYTMTNREIWQGGVLVSGDSRVNDDGRQKRVVSRREGGVLRVESPDFTGTPPEPVATTTYFTADFLKRGTWMSTDSGALFAVTATELAPGTVETAAGPVEARRWRVTNGAEFDVTLAYDSRGEWLSVAFVAGGEPAFYRPLDSGARLAGLWTAQ